MSESGKCTCFCILCNQFLLQFIYNQIIYNLYPVKDVSVRHKDFALADLLVHWTHLQPGHFYIQFSIFKFYIIKYWGEKNCCAVSVNWYPSFCFVNPFSFLFFWSLYTYFSLCVYSNGIINVLNTKHAKGSALRIVT